MKLLFFLEALFSKQKLHFEFSMNQISWQRFIIFEKLRHRGNLLLKLQAVEIAASFHWISSRSTYNKYTKTAVNSTMQFFESRYQKKCLQKVWSFLVHLPQNDGPVKFLQYWTETIF